MSHKSLEEQRKWRREYQYKYRKGIIGYAFVVADCLHYGHLNFLKECKKHCDFLIVGVYTDELTETYKRKPIIPFDERIELVRNLKPVDMVVTVHHRDCTPVLKELFEDGWKVKCLFHGDDWTPETDEDLNKSKKFIESIGGKLVQPKYYANRTTTSVIQEILRRIKGGMNVVGKQKSE